MVYEFDSCVLDTATQELTRDGEVVHVEPQVLAVLEYLLTHRDRVVTKIELLDEVWGDRFVSETALTSRIKHARKACGDSGREQRVIATVHGRGYRFVSETSEAPRPTPGPAGTPATGRRTPAPRTEADRGGTVVGRDAELAGLLAAAEEVAGGRRRCVFVTGEAGVGKSTLAAELLERFDGFSEWHVLRGQCLRTRGAVEPYFSLLDALGGLARTEPDAARDSLERAAPAWLAQLPALVDDELAERIERRLLGSTPQRMLREGADAFDDLAGRRPVLLLVEDLQWADDCTLDVIDLLVHRHDPVPLMLLFTARSEPGPAAELIAAAAGAPGAAQMALDPLGPEVVDGLVREHLGASEVPDGLTGVVASRSGGIPLFANEILDAWAREGRITVRDDRIELSEPLERLADEVPAGLVPLIAASLDSLAVEDRELLEAAAVAGIDYDSAAVAAGVGWAPSEADAHLGDLARRLAFVGAVGGTTWPDGTICTTYTFPHGAYRDVVYDRIPAARRALLHGRIGRALEDGHAGRAGDIAAPLAEHFQLAGELPKAVEYLRLAGEQAAGRNAHEHAARFFEEGMHLVMQLPGDMERDEAELRMRMASGPTVVATRGWFDEDVAHNYSRAIELCAERGPCLESAAARYGMATVTELRGQFERTEELLTPLLEREATGDLAMEAHELLACSTFHQGAFDRSLLNADMVLESWDEDAYSVAMSRIAEHPASSCNSWASLANWGLGHAALSLRQAERAVELGEENTYALSTAIAQRAMLHQLRGEPEDCVLWAERAREVAREQDFPMRMIQADMFRGWGLGTHGDPGEGDSLLAGGLERFRAAGARLNEAYYMGLHADVLLHAGRHAEALALLDGALERMGDGRSYFFEPELHRLRAAALLGPGGADGTARAGDDEVMDRARAALEASASAAERRGSPALALRTALARLDLEAAADGNGDGNGNARRRRDEVAALVAGLEPDDDSPDARRARELASA